MLAREEIPNIQTQKAKRPKMHTLTRTTLEGLRLRGYKRIQTQEPKRPKNAHTHVHNVVTCLEGLRGTR